MSNERIQILLIEDDERFAADFVKGLRNSPVAVLDVEWVTTAQAAQTFLQGSGKHSVDLIVADYDLSRSGGGSGVDVLAYAVHAAHRAYRVLTTSHRSLPPFGGAPAWDQMWRKEELLPSIEGWVKERIRRCGATTDQRCPFKRRGPASTCYLWTPHEDSTRLAALQETLHRFGISLPGADTAHDDWALASAVVAIIDVDGGDHPEAWIEIGRAAALHRRLIVLRQAQVMLPQHVRATSIVYPDHPPADEYGWLDLHLAKALRKCEFQETLRQKRQTGPVPGESGTRPIAARPPTRIHFFSATPVSGVPLDVSEEFRAVKEAIQGSTHRDRFDLNHRLAARVDDLLDELTRSTPEIVHFSGHGTAKRGLQFIGRDRNSQAVDGDLLRRIFDGRTHVKLVVFNACESVHHAEALLTFVDAAIAMEHPVGDDVAIEFSRCFYRSLCNGADLERAFADGVAGVAVLDPREAETPRLLTRSGSGHQHLFAAP